VIAHNGGVPPSAPSPGATRGRVLVVDDDAALAEMLGIVLRREGYEPAFVSDGNRAVGVFQQTRPDIVLLDLMLPGRNGLQICQDIRTQSSVPIVMLTAKGDTIDVVPGLEAGADDYVTKPFKPVVLVARVRAQLRRGETGQAENLTIGTPDSARMSRQTSTPSRPGSIRSSSTRSGLASLNAARALSPWAHHTGSKPSLRRTIESISARAASSSTTSTRLLTPPALAVSVTCFPSPPSVLVALAILCVPQPPADGSARGPVRTSSGDWPRVSRHRLGPQR